MTQKLLRNLTSSPTSPSSSRERTQDMGPWGVYSMRMMASVVAAFPKLQAVATTLRTARSAAVNGWGAIAYGEGVFHEVPQREIEILDRVGGGDSFASGLIYGLLAGRELSWALRCGVAHGALAMTTPGDTSMATLGEVLRAMDRPSARIER